MPRPKKITALFAEVRNGDKRLSDWMRANHDDLLVELGPGRIAWRQFMKVIEILGLVDERGKKPTRDTVARTWHRVRGDVATNRAKRRRKPEVLTPGEIAPGVRALPDHDSQTAEAVVEPGLTRPPIRLDIRPARPLAGMPAAAIQRPGVPPDTSGRTSVAVAAPGEDADAQFRRVFEAMDAARTPMPKPIP
jgi:hypothetical protein